MWANLLPRAPHVSKKLSSDFSDIHASIDAPTVDATMTRCANVFAVTFEKGFLDFDFSAATLIGLLIRSHLSTHLSIRTLASKHQEHPELLGDAFSLLREQVERVFVVVRLLVEPRVYARRYHQDDARRAYLYHKRSHAERSNLSRFAADTEDMEARLWAIMEPAGLTAEQIERLDFEAEHPDEPIRGRLGRPEYLVVGFPTPGSVAKGLKDHPAGIMLRRWQLEYLRVSGVTHLGFEKLLYAQPLRPDTRGESHMRRLLEDAAIREVVCISWVALASLLTECYAAVNRLVAPARRDSLAQHLALFWDDVRELSLVGKWLWEHRASSVLPSRRI